MLSHLFADLTALAATAGAEVWPPVETDAGLRIAFTRGDACRVVTVAADATAEAITEACRLELAAWGPAAA
jgi:hypothetical protein